MLRPKWTSHNEQNPGNGNSTIWTAKLHCWSHHRKGPFRKDRNYLYKAGFNPWGIHTLSFEMKQSACKWLKTLVWIYQECLWYLELKDYSKLWLLPSLGHWSVEIIQPLYGASSTANFPYWKSANHFWHAHSATAYWT